MFHMLISFFIDKQTNIDAPDACDAAGWNLVCAAVCRAQTLWPEEPPAGF
jgi:hypothetical protein